MTSPIRVVLTTVAEASRAEQLSSELVTAHIAACVSVIPGITSFYAWEERIVSEREWLLLIKTTDAKIPALRAFLAQHHPYTVPEFIVLSPAYVGPSYAQWLTNWLAQEP